MLYVIVRLQKPPYLYIKTEKMTLTKVNIGYCGGRQFWYGTFFE